jgi:DNA-binding transcriptional regulator/RsmH inhibitor MraZ
VHSIVKFERGVRDMSSSPAVTRRQHMNTEYPTTETIREYQKEIEAGIREAHADAVHRQYIPQSWTVVCRVNAHGDVSVVDGNTNGGYIWGADGWHVVALFHTDDITLLRDALAAFRAEIQA